MADPTPEQMLELTLKQWNDLYSEQSSYDEFEKEEQEDLLFEMIAEIQEEEDDELWWKLILGLVATSPDKEEPLGKVASGTLEDFLHGPKRVEQFSSQIFEQTKENPKFRKCIQGVWFATNKEYPKGFLEKLGKLAKITILKA